MDSKLHCGLPPLKRFRLPHKDYSSSQSPMPPPHLPLLPVKKRKESRNPSVDDSDDFDSLMAAAAGVTTICRLPAKKRVWAPPPNFSLVKSHSAIDLNVEYKPISPEEGQERDEDREPAQIPVAIVPDRSSCGDKEAAVKRQDEESEEKDVNEDEDGILCAICESTDGDPLDPIVFCDGCNLMVHSTCYGNPLAKGVPDGDWFCARCLMLSQSSSSSSSSHKEADHHCCLCPITGGALKPTNNGRWAHVVCALFVPEVFFEDPEGREGINYSQVPRKRWKEVCYVCKGTNGCAIECSELNCPLGFHVTCGFKEGLCIEYKQGKKKGAIVAGFCKQHTALWEQQKSTGKFKIVARDL
ncbi:hypothetical protein Dimus_012762 [Dionaea muscipula]